MKTFKPGDRVQMSNRALRMGLDGPCKRRIGTVVKIIESDYLSVKRDGILRTELWHQKFWEKLR